VTFVALMHTFNYTRPRVAPSAVSGMRCLSRHAGLRPSAGTVPARGKRTPVRSDQRVVHVKPFRVAATALPVRGPGR
jgi:hypothetical protein